MEMFVYKSVADYRREWEKWRDENIALPYSSPEAHDFELWLIKTVRREERAKFEQKLANEI